jgi:hypothetical protein
MPRPVSNKPVATGRLGGFKEQLIDVEEFDLLVVDPVPPGLVRPAGVGVLE